MKNMLKLLGLGTVLSLAVACGGGGGVDEVVKLSKEACACKDKSCAESVNKKMDAALKGIDEGKVSEEDGKKLMGAMLEGGMCLAKHGIKAE